MAIKMLSVDLEKQLGDFAVTASFQSAGLVTGLFGNSGAGKTSIIKDRKSTRLNSSHIQKSRMPSSA